MEKKGKPFLCKQRHSSFFRPHLNQNFFRLTINGFNNSQLIWLAIKSDTLSANQQIYSALKGICEYVDLTYKRVFHLIKFHARRSLYVCGKFASFSAVIYELQSFSDVLRCVERQSLLKEYLKTVFALSSVSYIIHLSKSKLHICLVAKLFMIFSSTLVKLLVR